MNAQQARDEAQANLARIAAHAVKRVRQAIASEVAQGHVHARYTLDKGELAIHEAIANVLRTEGYKVHKYDDRDPRDGYGGYEHYLSISW